MDDIPKSIIGQIFQDWHCYCLRKILWSEVAKYNEKGFWKAWFSLLSKIPVSVPFSQFRMYERKSRKNSKNRVRCLAFPATGTLYKKNPISERYGMPKSWFTDRTEYLFEGKKLFSSRDYDTVLKYIYGDYMKIPDAKGREQHSPFSEIIFPDE
jgi:lipopolysaccharide cholinephosphotransferase